MALLQIAEPGQSPQPHQRRLAVGIDLGTTNSLVAALRSGLSEPLVDANGQVILPSAVRYHADRVEVGDAHIRKLRPQRDRRAAIYWLGESDSSEELEAIAAARADVKAPVTSTAVTQLSLFSL